MQINYRDSTITQIENKYIQNKKQKENVWETYLGGTTSQWWPKNEERGVGNGRARNGGATKQRW